MNDFNRLYPRYVRNRFRRRMPDKKQALHGCRSAVPVPCTRGRPAVAGFSLASVPEEPPGNEAHTPLLSLSPVRPAAEKTTTPFSE